MPPVATTQELIQSPERAASFAGLSLISLALLAFNYRAFDRDLGLTVTQLSALLAIADVQTYTATDAQALREQFDGVDTLFDAFCFSVITGSTVGYDDIYPQTTTTRLFGVSALLITVTTFTVAFGVLLTPATKARPTKILGRVIESQLDILENHALVLGYGKLTEPIFEELGDRARVVIVTPNEGHAKCLTGRGYDVVTDDLSDEGMLRRTRADTAHSVVVTMNNDTRDILAILTARQLDPDMHTVTATTQRENEWKPRRAGTNTVISPAALDGHFLAEPAVGGNDPETIEKRLLDEQSTEPAESGAGEAGDPGTGDHN